MLGDDFISPFWVQILMKIPETCRILCGRKYKKDELEQFADKIEDEYRVNWYFNHLQT